MTTGWKQLALAVCDAQARLDVPGYIDALDRVIAAAQAARAEVLAALETPAERPEPTEADQ